MNAEFASWLRAIELDPSGFASTVTRDPSILTRPGPCQETLLHWLSVEGRAESVKLLAQLGAKVDTVNEFQNTPLMECAQMGNALMVSVLLELGANPNCQSLRDKNTAIHLAAESGYKEVVDLLLSHGSDPTLRNAYGETFKDMEEFSRRWVRPPGGRESKK
jgi:hypothetical protein